MFMLLLAEGLSYPTVLKPLLLKVTEILTYSALQRKERKRRNPSYDVNEK